MDVSHAEEPAAADRRRRFRRRVGRVATVALPALTLAILTLFAATGYLDRHRGSDEPYPLFFTRLADEPGRVILITAVCAAIYTAVFLILAALVRRWTSERERRAGTPGRVTRAVDWVLARWWRVSLLIAVMWAPLYIMQAPGTSNADLIMQALEVLGDRSEMSYPPFDVYPIAHSLIPSDDVLLSNHHNVLLTLFYGYVLGASIDLFGSFKLGLLVLTSTQALFTLIAFGRGMSLVARRVDSRALRVLGLVALVLCGYPVALWSMAMAKNPLFAAAFVWWLALSIDYVRSRRPMSAWRIAEWAVVTLVMLISAKFAAYIIAVQIVVLLVARWRKRSWMAVAVSLAVPLAVFQVALKIGFTAGVVIPGDPLEAKAVQIQTMALILREEPDALSPEDRQRLEPIFDVDAMGELFDPWTMGSVRGAGYQEGAYKWCTVTQEQTEEFDSIWQNLAQREPRLVADGVMLTSFRYFDPRSHGSDNWPSVHADDGISSVLVDGNRFSDDGVNDHLRGRLDQFVVFTAKTPGLNLLLESAPRVVLIVLLAAVGIALKRPAVWAWAFPIALHCAVLIGSPLSSSGRYALGISYALPLVIMALGVRRAPDDDDEVESSPAESLVRR